MQRKVHNNHALNEARFFSFVSFRRMCICVAQGSVEGHASYHSMLCQLYFNDIATQGVRFASSSLNTQNATHKSVHSLFHCLSVADLEIQ